MSFKYQLGDCLVISASNENGPVIGRAEYTIAEPSYLLRYQASDGRAVESWWTESALESRPPVIPQPAPEPHR